MTYPQLHDSKQVFGLGKGVAHAKKETARNSVCTAEPSLTSIAIQERLMATIPLTARSPSAQDTPRATYDGISVRDDLLRRQAERGSEMLLRAMIRELESMGVLA